MKGIKRTCLNFIYEILIVDNQGCTLCRTIEKDTWQKGETEFGVKEKEHYRSLRKFTYDL